MSSLESLPQAAVAEPRPLSGWLAAPLCLLIALAVYLPGIRGAEFLNFDDPFYFGPGNELFAHASDVARAHGFWSGLLVVLDPRQVVADVYLPVAHASLWLDYWWFDGTPFGPHVVAVVLHALAAFLLLRFLAALRIGAGMSAFVVVAFLAHPALCESVAWVSGRKDVLSGVFVFAALAIAARAAARPTPARFVAIAACTVLAMYAKATAVVLPLLLLLVCAALPGPRRRFLAPLLALLVTAPIAWHHQLVAAAQGTMVGGSVADRLPQVPGVLGHYLWTALWPTGLNVLYPEVLTLERLRAAWLPATAVLGVVLAVAVWCWRRPRLRAVGVGVFGFALAVLPFNSAYPASVIAVADRYLYLAVPFALLAVAGLGAELLRSPAARRLGQAVRELAGFDQWPRALVRAGAALCALPFVLLAFGRVPVFASSERLWRASLATEGENAVALLNLVNVLAGRATGGDALATVRPLVERAAAAARYPEHEQRARLLLARFALLENRGEEAARQIELAIVAAERAAASGRVARAAGDTLVAQTVLAAVEPYRRLGRPAAARAALERAQALAPADPGVLATEVLLAVEELGVAVQADGKPLAAADARAAAIDRLVAHARAAVAGDDAQVECAAGMFARLRGRRLEAIACFRRALARQPDFVDAALGAADVCIDAGLFDAAEEYARDGIAVARRVGAEVDPRLRLALARAQKGLGRLDDAIRSLEEYTRQQPRDRDAARLYSGLLMHKARERLSEHDVTHAELQDLVDRALAVNPQEPAVDLVRARMARDSRQFADAIAALDRLAKAMPDFEDTRTLLAENLRDLGYERLFQRDDAGAIAAWRRFLAVVPAGVPVDAVQMQMQALWRRSEDAGIAARARGDRAGAERAFRTCLEIDPDQHWASWLLASLLVDDPAADLDELDRLSAAAVRWQEEHHLDRSRQVAVRAIVLGRRGRADEARQLLGDYLAQPDADAADDVLELLRSLQHDRAGK